MRIIVFLLLPVTFSALAVFLLVRALVLRGSNSKAPVWVFYWISTVIAFTVGPVVAFIWVAIWVYTPLDDDASVAWALVTPIPIIEGLAGGILGSIVAIRLFRGDPR